MDIECRTCGAADHPSGCAEDFARPLVVTDEYFDYLRAEADRPPRIDPRTVELFRSVRGTITHR